MDAGGPTNDARVRVRVRVRVTDPSANAPEEIDVGRCCEDLTRYFSAEAHAVEGIRVAARVFEELHEVGVVAGAAPSNLAIPHLVFLKSQVESARRALPVVQSFMDELVVQQLTALRSALIERYDSILLCFVHFASNNLRWLRIHVLGASVAANTTLSNREFNRIQRLFHPDKNSRNLRHVLTEFLTLIKEERQASLDSNATPGLNELLAEGARCFKIAKDLNNAIRNSSKRLELGLSGETELELRNKLKTSAENAFLNYRAATKLLLEPEDGGGEEARLTFISQHAAFRAMMAVSLVLGGSTLEAELYSFSAMFFLEYHSKGESRRVYTGFETLTEARVAAANARELIRRRQCDQSSRRPSTSTQEHETSTDTQNKEVTRPGGWRQLAHYERRSVSACDNSSVVLADVRQSILTLWLHGATNVADVVLTHAGILKVEEHLTRSYARATVDCVGAGLSAFVGWGTAANALVGVTSIGMAVPTVGAAILICGGLAYTASGFISNANRALHEPQVRRNLNSIMKRCIDAFLERKYKEFLQIMSENWLVGNGKGSSAENPRYVCPLLITTASVDRSDYASFEVHTTHVIAELLSHEFRPDGIAWIFSMLCEALTNGYVSFSELQAYEVREQCCRIMDDVLSNKELSDAAEKLDQNVRETMSHNVLLRKFYEFADEHHREMIAEAREAPFKARLDEVMATIQINKIIVKLLQLTPDAIDAAERLLRGLRRKALDDFSFFSPIVSRVEALEDLLFIVSPSNFDDVQGSVGCPLLLQQEPQEDALAQAAHIERVAQRHHESFDSIQASYAWGQAELLYRREFCDIPNNQLLFGLEYDTTLVQAVLGAARCLVKRGNFQQAKELLLKTRCDILRHHWEYEYLLALVACRFGEYDDALLHNSFSVQFGRGKPAAIEQRKFLKLHAARRVERTTSAAEPLQHPRNVQPAPQQPTRNVLCIDGGGMRGLIPAIFLQEFEKASKRRVADVFPVIAGTSTGAMIAAHCAFRFDATEAVALYKHQGASIWTRPWPVGRYAPDGLASVLRGRFQHRTLAHVDPSVSLLIVAAEVTNPTPGAFVFNSREAREHAYLNFKVVDALMASTAAPTYFPVHIIRQRQFTDGGVVANNPSGLAFEEVKHTDDQRKVFLWSLGTGSYSPDADSSLFWREHLNLALSGANHDVCRSLCRDSRIDFVRWQMQLGKPIPLDAYDDNSLQMMEDMAYAFMDELEASDSPHNLQSLLRKLDL